MSKLITSPSGLAGIKYWAQHYLHRTPRYEVFVYLGKQSDTGLHVFRSVKENVVIGKQFHQLNVGGFHPFCLDFEAIMKFLETQDEEKRNAPV